MDDKKILLKRIDDFKKNTLMYFHKKDRLVEEYYQKFKAFKEKKITKEIFTKWVNDKKLKEKGIISHNFFGIERRNTKYNFQDRYKKEKENEKELQKLVVLIYKYFAKISKQNKYRLDDSYDKLADLEDFLDEIPCML